MEWGRDGEDEGKGLMLRSDVVHQKGSGDTEMIALFRIGTSDGLATLVA